MKKIIKLLPFGATLGLAILILFSLLSSGYYGDDILNISIPSRLELDKLSLWDFTLHHIKSWISLEGRFFIALFYTTISHTITSSLFQYKALMLLSNLVAIGACMYCVYTLTKSKKMSILSGLIVPTLFQFRIYHDPILAYNGLLQIILTYTLLSAAFFKNYLESKKIGWYISSIFLFLLAIFSYEISYPFFLFHAAIAYDHHRSIKKSIVQTLPYLGSTFLAVGLSLFLRKSAQVLSDGYAMNFDFIALFSAYAKQLYGTLPFAYHFSQEDPLVCTEISCFFQRMTMLDIMTITIFGWIFFKNISAIKQLNKKAIIAVIGILLWALPGALTSTAVKHQNELFWGASYLPVYLQYFGLTLLGISVMAYIIQKVPKLYTTVITLIFAITSIAGLTHLQDNRTVITAQNIGMHTPWKILTTGLENGLTKNIAEKSTIINKQDMYFYVNDYFYHRYSGERFNIKRETDYIRTFIHNDQESFKLIDFNGNDTYIIRSFAPHENGGYILLGRVKNYLVDTKTMTPLQINVDYLRIFMLEERKYQNSKRSNTITAKVLSTNNTYSNEPFAFNKIRLLDQGVIDAEHEYRIMEISDKIIELNSVGISNQSSYLNTQKTAIQKPKTENTHFSRNKNTVLHSVFNNPLVFNLKNNELIGIDEGKSVSGLINNASMFDASSTKSINLAAINTKPNFTIEMVLKSGENIARNNVIMGTHPAGNSGFAIEENGSGSLSSYTASFGNGREWSACQPKPLFSLEENQWHYITVQFTQNTITIYKDGQKVSESNCLNGPIKHNQAPLIIANWSQFNRPFVGAIEEVHISNGILSENIIQNNWKKINEQKK